MTGKGGEEAPGLGSIVSRECSYDQEGDVIYLSIGRPRPAIVWESPEGVLVRLDPETRDLVGMTVTWNG